MPQAARPRPRPRLVSRQAALSSESKPTASNDEDDFFRRNKGRTAQHWRQLEQSDAKAVPFTRSDDDWEPVDLGEGSFSRPRKKKKPIKQNDRPRWQDTDTARILSSDSEDNDILFVDTTSSSQNSASPEKRKRQRNRSRSITPPPELPAHQRTNAMILVRQALDIRPRSPSPSFFLDESTDTLDLDPELAKIAEAVRQRVICASVDPKHVGGPEAVNMKVHWRPHPLNTSAKEQYWTFKLGRHDTFRELFDGVADLAGVMTDQLMISHDHRRVFASATPHSLHIWAEGELDACDKHTDEYMRAQQSNRGASPSIQETLRSSPSVASRSDVESDAESTGGDTIRLVLRSAVTKDKTFPLTVRSTTTCEAIVKAFLKAAALPDRYSSGMRKGTAALPQIVVDGDKMDPEAEIGEAELEDGDLVEIVGV